MPKRLGFGAKAVQELRKKCAERKNGETGELYRNRCEERISPNDAHHLFSFTTLLYLSLPSLLEGGIEMEADRVLPLTPYKTEDLRGVFT